MNRYVPLVALLAGCPPFIWGAPPEGPGDVQNNPRDTGGSLVEDTDRPEDSGEQDPTDDDTGTASPYAEPYYYVVVASFGWDAEGRRFYPFVLPRTDGSESEIPLQITVTLFPDTGGSLGLPICAFSILPPPFENPDHDADDVPDLDGAQLGTPFSALVHLEGASAVWDTCGSRLDPDVWGRNAPELLERLHTPWAVALVGDLTGPHREALEDNVRTLGGDWTEYDDEALAARVWNAGVGVLSPGGADAWHLRVASGTFDGTGRIVVDYDDANQSGTFDTGESLSFLPAADVVANLPTGYYSVVGSYLIGGFPVAGLFVEAP